MSYKKRNTITTISIDNTVLDKLRAEASNKDRSVSYLIRLAINDYLETIKQPRQ